MKRFATAVVLVCALSTSIFAGDMPTDGKAAPTPTPAATSSTSSTSGTLLVSVILTILSLR
ncbi:MAG TPA: hypothetical protein VJR02_19175 [Pyrinomonadaceae bacterium]|nr:hypothetical protein [Pyrinomonadaceae bacterium]